MGEGIHLTVIGIMTASRRWVTEPTVVGYGSFSDDVRFYILTDSTNTTPHSLIIVFIKSDFPLSPDIILQ